MKIALLLPSLANTGPGIVVRELAGGLTARGHECTVFYFDDVVELDMPCPTARLSWGCKFDFSRWDVVHSHMLRPDLWVWLRRRGGGRFITTLHNPITYKAFRTFFSRLNSFAGSTAWHAALTRIDRIVALNDDTRQSLPRFLRRKAVVIPNGRDIQVVSSISETEHAAAIARLRERYRVVGTVCGMYHRKGIEQVVEALAELPEFCFVGVGDGPQLAEWKALAAARCVAERCYWVGQTSRATEYYSALDVFVLPSRSEGFPLAMIEAAAYGLPIVLSDIPIFRAIAGERDFVLRVALDSPSELAAAIRQAWENRAAWGRATRAYYEQELTAGRMTERYLEEYGNK